MIQHLIDFLSEGTSAFHVTAYSIKVLENAGFQKLVINDDWKLMPGGRYYCSPFDTTVYAFTIGEHCDLHNGIHMAGAHTDFPSIKIKANPELHNHDYVQLNTEVYGGPILNTFFDRPLSLSGKVVTKGERYDKPVSHLIDFKRPMLVLPNLAVHMSRGVNENGAPIDNQHHLLPMLGMISEQLNKDTKLVDILAKELGVPAEDVLDYDLNIYNLEKPYLCGINEDFLASPRLDNITSCCALVHGLIESSNADRVNLIALFDNEEIGSLSKQGADSEMPAIILSKIWQAFGKSHTDCMSDIAAGMLLSTDVAHAYHPNYPTTQDITNYPLPNKGFVLKTAANQSYATDCEINAALLALCKEEDIPVQRFAKHSNVRSGGTIGSMISSHLPMRTSDLGVGLLAMHSSCEFMGKNDQEAIERFMCAFFTK